MAYKTIARKSKTNLLPYTRQTVQRESKRRHTEYKLRSYEYSEWESSSNHSRTASSSVPIHTSEIWARIHLKVAQRDSSMSARRSRSIWVHVVLRMGCRHWDNANRERSDSHWNKAIHYCAIQWGRSIVGRLDNETIEDFEPFILPTHRLFHKRSTRNQRDIVEFIRRVSLCLTHYMSRHRRSRRITCLKFLTAVNRKRHRWWRVHYAAVGRENWTDLLVGKKQITQSNCVVANNPIIVLNNLKQTYKLRGYGQSVDDCDVPILSTMITCKPFVRYIKYAWQCYLNKTHCWRQITLFQVNWFNVLQQAVIRQVGKALVKSFIGS